MSVSGSVRAGLGGTTYEIVYKSAQHFVGHGLAGHVSHTFEAVVDV